MPAVETPLSPNTIALYLTAPFLMPRKVPTRPSFQVPVTTSAIGVEVQVTDSQPGPMIVNSVSMPWTACQYSSAWCGSVGQPP